MIRGDIKEILRNMKVADAELFTCACDIEDYIDNLLKMVEQGEHYKHLYSLVKKQKDDAVKFIKEKGLKEEEWQNGFCIKATATYTRDEIFDLLRMLGEIDDNKGIDE